MAPYYWLSGFHGKLPKKKGEKKKKLLHIIKGCTMQKSGWTPVYLSHLSPVQPGEPRWMFQGGFAECIPQGKLLKWYIQGYTAAEPTQGLLRREKLGQAPS